MEQKMVEIPFDLDLAKKITSGEVEGRILTEAHNSVRIICFDRKNDMPIVALINIEGKEYHEFYDTTGHIAGENKTMNFLMLEVPEYVTFKDGDVIVGLCADFEGKEYMVFKLINGSFIFFHFCLDSYTPNTFLFNSSFVVRKYKELRKATEKEVEIVRSFLRESKNYGCAEAALVLAKTNRDSNLVGKLKPFDKVLVRDNNEDSEWRCALFSHKNEDGLYICAGSIYEQCILYEGNEHLLGTTEKPENYVVQK